MKLIKRTVLFLLIVSALVILLAGCGRKTIVVNDYLSIEATGTDHLGTAKARLDWEKMVSDNLDVFNMKSMEDDAELLAVMLHLDKGLRGELDKTFGLRNGDQITYHWDDSGIEALEEKYNVTFKVEDVTITVSGLKP